MNIYFQYNPYTLEAIFETEENESVQEELDRYLQTKEGKPLQTWIHEVPSIVSDIVNDNCEMTFHGTVNDFEDVRAVIQSFNEQKNNNVQMTVAHQEVAESEERLEQLKAIFEDIQQGPFDELKEESIVQSFQKVLDSEVEVAVIATMSSGKSTVINAMLGKDLMPTRNEATTASITRITHAPQEHYEARPVSKEGHVLEDWKEAHLELMDAYNDDEEVFTTELRGPLRIQSKNGVNIALVDTPGPNNSQDASHRKATFDFIKSKEMPLILYVLNATQLGIEDDAALLRSLQREMDTSNIQAQERFIFAVNKIDALDPERETVEHILANAKSYLQDNGIEKPRVFPITAKFAQLLRMNLSGESLGRKDERLLKDHEYLEEDYQLVEHAMLNERERKSIEREIEEARQRGEEEQVSLFYTGMPPLEKAIESYFEKYALPFKVNEALSTFEDLVEGRIGEQKVLEELNEKMKENASIEEQFEIVRKVVEEAQSIDESFIQEHQKEMIREFSEKLTAELSRGVAETHVLFDDEKLKRKEGLVYVDDFNAWLKKFQSTYKDLLAEIQSELENEMNEQLEDLGNNAIDELKDRLRAIIGDEIDGLDDYLLADLGTIQMDDVVAKLEHKDFVEANRKEIKEKVGETFVKTSEWWKPWTWGKGYHKDIIEKREVVKMEDIIGHYQEPALKNLASTGREARDILTNQLGALSQALSIIFETTKEQLQEKEQELEQLAHQLDEGERELEKRKENYEWLRKINERLKQVTQL